MEVIVGHWLHPTPVAPTSLSHTHLLHICLGGINILIQPFGGVSSFLGLPAVSLKLPLTLQKRQKEDEGHAFLQEQSEEV